MRRIVAASASLEEDGTNLPTNRQRDRVDPVRTEMPSSRDSVILRYQKPILFLTAAICLAGVYSAMTMPASVFPQTDFPRVVILIDNGVMPADEMMATITRPVEEAMKNIPGTVNIRSATGRGSAEVNVFFDWSTDMVQSELYVLSRLSEIRASLPAAAEIAVHRLTFSAFPIIGISLTSDTRSATELWETARYDIYPPFLRLKGVARINLVGGRIPEYHVVVDPLELEAHHLRLGEVVTALTSGNLFVPAGMTEENHQLYLNVVDNRLRSPEEIGNVVVAWSGDAPVRVRDFAAVRRGAAPQFNIVSAEGKEAVLLNVYSQPDGNTVAIADALRSELARLRPELPPDMHLAFFYDQSLFVREGVRSVWESIFFGLALSAIVLYLFLRSLSTTVVAAAVIPVTVLFTLVGIRACGMSFNLMTLGGIAAAIGLIIDDAIVVVEAIYAKVFSGNPTRQAVGLALHEVGFPLVGSTLTPVVVFLPLAFLDGVPGVFFRALALSMVFALLSSLLLAVTWTPALATLLIRKGTGTPRDELQQGGAILHGLIAVYEWVVRRALRHAVLSLLCIVLVAASGVFLYRSLQTDFLPEQDEGAFVLDYFTRPGTSLSETDRMLRHVERILNETPEIESFSRRTGARLALAIAEPNTGDFLVKLRPNRDRSTEDVIDELREKIHAAEPALHTEFPGVLSDLIGDLTWSPDPVEIKVFSTDTRLLKEKSEEIAQAIETISGVVDVNDGLVVAGPSRRFRVDTVAAARLGLTAESIGTMLQTTSLGTKASYLLQGDRAMDVRVVIDPEGHTAGEELETLPTRSAAGSAVPLRDVATVEYEPGILEMHREDLRQLNAVSARFSGIDMGSGIRAIKAKLAETVKLPPEATIEYGGLYQQQQESFRNLAVVLVMATVLVFSVLLFEFRSFIEPLAIVMGALLALVGVIGALWVTETSLNIVSFLGAIIGVGIVAKNGILMLDFVDRLRMRGFTLVEALVQSGRRRLRPVLMTSLTTFLGLLPLAYGVGAGADMLRPLAIGVIGALVISLVLSLVATPVFYLLMYRLVHFGRTDETTDPSLAETNGADT